MKTRKEQKEEEEEGKGSYLDSEIGKEAPGTHCRKEESLERKIAGKKNRWKDESLEVTIVGKRN